MSTAVPSGASGYLEGILAEGTRKNKIHEITGVLILEGEHFLHVLEGPRIAVEDTFLKIAVDRRHRSIQVLSRKLVDRRDFGNWAMANYGTSAANRVVAARIYNLINVGSAQTRAAFALVFLGDSLRKEAPEETSAFVRKMQSYQLLTNDEVDLLTGFSEPSYEVPPGRDLIREGERPGSLFVVLEGWACRYKVIPNGSRQIIAFMLPGDFCDLHVGELDEMDHSIGTLTTCRVMAIPRAKIEALIVATPGLTRAFWRAQLIDESVLRAWIVGLGRRNGLERVAHLMLELYVRLRTVGVANTDTCQVPLTQPVLADAVGMTPVHVNRVLKVLRERGIMELGSGTLNILDVSELARLAGFDDTYLHQRIKRAA